MPKMFIEYSTIGTISLKPSFGTGMHAVLQGHDLKRTRQASNQEMWRGGVACLRCPWRANPIWAIGRVMNDEGALDKTLIRICCHSIKPWSK